MQVSSRAFQVTSRAGIAMISQWDPCSPHLLRILLGHALGPEAEALDTLLRNDFMEHLHRWM
ncbi:MAG: hypothetical protein IPN44_07705 [Flavobacteriales bacterium]|nr:hypothetical protein [Flavobacteriales bacterium]